MENLKEFKTLSMPMRRRSFLAGAGLLMGGGIGIPQAFAQSSDKTGVVRVWGEPGPYAGVAVQAMILRTDSHQIMDELFALGARGIIITSVHACRL